MSLAAAACCSDLPVPPPRAWNVHGAVTKKWIVGAQIEEKIRDAKRNKVHKTKNSQISQISVNICAIVSMSCLNQRGRTKKKGGGA